MNHAIQKPLHSYPRLRRFATDVAITSVFDVLIALFITYVVRVNSSFVDNLVISACIGTFCVSFIAGGRLLIWGLTKPPKVPFFIMLFISIAVGQQLGNLLASYLLHIPVENLAAARIRNPTSYIVVTFLVGLSITWFFWTRGTLEHLRAEAAAEKARATAIEKQAIQAQLQMLQAQIEPHMLFNTLANLQGLIAVDAARAQHMLDQLIQYLRATLSSSRSETTTLGQEFSLLEAYLGLMTVRMGSRLAYALHLPDELRALPLAPMLLQPLVENAIKHGLEPKIDGGHIDVRAARDGDRLTLSVIDNGLGLDAADSAGTQVGVANIRERLQALYGDRAGFSLIPNTPHGVTAQITIPL